MKKFLFIALILITASMAFSQIPVVPLPGSTVTDGTSSGLTSTAGTSKRYSRADHAHGTPVDSVGTTTAQVVSLISSSISTHASATVSVHGFDSSGNVPYATLAGTAANAVTASSAPTNTANILSIATGSNWQSADQVLVTLATHTTLTAAHGASGAILGRTTADGLYAPISVTTTTTLPFTAITGTVSAAQVGSGSPSGAKYLRDDMTWQTVTSGGTTTAYVQSIENKIQSLGTRTGNYTVDFSQGCISTVTVTQAVATITIPDWPFADYTALCKLIITQSSTTARAQTLGAASGTNNNIRSSGGLMSAGDTLPNSGIGSVDEYWFEWRGNYWAVVNALFDLKL